MISERVPTQRQHCRSTLPLSRLSLAFLGVLLISAAFFVPTWSVGAQDDGKTQVLTGRLNVNDGDAFRMPNLEKGEILYAYLTRTSGNLDPFLAVFDRTYEPGELRAEYLSQLDMAIAEGIDPVEAISDIADGLALAWDDDSGTGYDAALRYVIPADGDYCLLAMSGLTKDTFGDYVLSIGLDAPEVLSGAASSSGDLIAFSERKASSIGESVQEITGTLTLDNSDVYYKLRDINVGEGLYVYAEATAGDLTPRLMLNDSGDKPLRSANLFGDSITATLAYEFGEDSSGNTLHLFGHRYQEQRVATAGDYRLLLGINAPEVLTGTEASRGGAVLKGPTPVAIGIFLNQITKVDQTAENFGAVASLNMKWKDPKLAFSPDSCDCTQQVFTGDSFAKFADDNDVVWPQFTLLNQQGNRWTQNRNVIVTPDGSAQYFERFTTDLQAPEFDFVKFPFDQQSLYIRVLSLFTEDVFILTDPPELSSIGSKLGEEEWYIVDSRTEIDTYGEVRSSFSLAFDVRRHLNFYIFRIFLPIILIITVSWFTFFLKDYGKRIDVTSGNLLLFIAFNFAISNELPRLGYLTFMDSILVMTFVVSALVIVFNVYLKHKEQTHQGRLITLVRVIDTLMIWLYPMIYMLGAALMVRLFLIP